MFRWMRGSSPRMTYRSMPRRCYKPGGVGDDSDAAGRGQPRARQGRIRQLRAWLSAGFRARWLGLSGLCHRHRLCGAGGLWITRGGRSARGQDPVTGMAPGRGHQRHDDHGAAVRLGGLAFAAAGRCGAAQESSCSVYCEPEQSNWHVDMRKRAAAHSASRNGHGRGDG